MKIVDHKALLEEVGKKLLTAQRVPGATVYGSFGDGFQEGWCAAERFLREALNAAHDAHDVPTAKPVGPGTPRDVDIGVWHQGKWILAKLEDTNTYNGQEWFDRGDGAHNQDLNETPPQWYFELPPAPPADGHLD